MIVESNNYLYIYKAVKYNIIFRKILKLKNNGQKI